MNSDGCMLMKPSDNQRCAPIPTSPTKVTKIINNSAIKYIKYEDLIQVLIFESDTQKNIPSPNIIFSNCDKANGVQEPPPAENKTKIENNKTTHIGINNANEKRESFSPKFIIFALETRVIVILF